VVSDQKKIVSTELKVLVDELLSSKALRAKSLISTVMGDLAMPYGGFVWGETLSDLLKPFGISDRLVRTSIFRLTEDGWLKGTRSGRKSYYSLTDLGASQTKLAESLIYHREVVPWDGNWTLVFLVIAPVDVEARKQLEQELIWIGFGKVANGVWAHPCIETDVVLDRVRELNLLNKVICMKCQNIEGGVDGFNLNDRDLAVNCLPISDVKRAYQDFIERFRRFEDVSENMIPYEMLILRILLVDQYRKIVLNDPNLPVELLPEDWNGISALTLTKRIYHSVQTHSDKLFVELLNQNGDKHVPDYDTQFANRFNNHGQNADC